MDQERLQLSYAAWVMNESIKPVRDMYKYSIGNYDLYEDNCMLVNRIYYLILHRSNLGLRTFTFFSENVFTKTRDGDLKLVFTEYGIEEPQRK